MAGSTYGCQKLGTPICRVLAALNKTSQNKGTPRGAEIVPGRYQDICLFSTPTLLISLPLVAQARNGSKLLVKSLVDFLNICQNLAFIKYRHYLK